MQPPVEHGTMERYRAFSPGRNVGVRDTLNAPVSKRIIATSMDLTIYTAVMFTTLVTLTIAFGQAWWWLVLLLGPIPFFLWQSAFDAGGGSVGKRLLGLRVVGPADTPIDMGDACRRNLWLLLPIIPIAGPVAALAVGGWYASSAKADAFGMGPHDRFARTRVIVKPEQS